MSQLFQIRKKMLIADDEPCLMSEPKRDHRKTIPRFVQYGSAVSEKKKMLISDD